MIKFDFEKKGIKFSFRNPKWDSFYKQLRMEWKVIGIKENDKNDGYFYNSEFSPNRNAMILNGIEMDGKRVEGVIPPADILEKIRGIYEEFKKEDYQRRLNQDITYTMNNTAAYGIYNGISEFDIGAIIGDVQRELDSKVFLMPGDIATILNRDEELKAIAKETPGYGTIPNKIIREKIKEIILEETTKENNREQKEKDRLNHLFKMAKETGEKQLINEWIENCNDEHMECSLDLCSEWAMPDGTREFTRTHTF